MEGMGALGKAQGFIRHKSMSLGHSFGDRSPTVTCSDNREVFATVGILPLIHLIENVIEVGNAYHPPIVIAFKGKCC